MSLFPRLDPLDWVMRQRYDFMDDAFAIPPTTLNVTVQQYDLLLRRVAQDEVLWLAWAFNEKRPLFGMALQIVEPLPAELTKGASND